MMFKFILIKNFITGIKNIFQYLPIIYKDRDWDYAFLDYLILFKLKRMSKLMDKNNRHIDTKTNVKRMNFCIKILERLVNDDYKHPEQIYGRFSTRDETEKYMIWSEHQRCRDRRLLYKIFERYIEKWWD